MDRNMGYVKKYRNYFGSNTKHCISDNIFNYIFSRIIGRLKNEENMFILQRRKRTLC